MPSLQRPPRTQTDWNAFLTSRGPMDEDNGLRPPPVRDGSDWSVEDRPESQLGGEGLDDTTNQPQDHWHGAARNVSSNLSLHSAATEMCRLLKKSKKLSPESEADLDVFASTRDIGGALAIVLANVLETRDMVKAIRKSSSWEVPNELQDHLRNLTNAIVCCHNVSSYRGKIPAQIIEAARELKAPGLPADSETSKMKKIATLIGAWATQARYNLKHSIETSVSDDGANISNIADLAATVVGKTDLKPTVQMWIRLAFLRQQYEVNINTDGESENWWIKVDQELEKLRSSASSTVALSEYFNSIFEEDKQRFGDPAESEEKATEAAALPRWQVTLQSYAPKISSATKGKKTTKKRKISEIDDDQAEQGDDA